MTSIPSRALVSVLVVTSLVGCATGRVAMSSKWDQTLKPSYVDYLDAYFLGLIGREQVDLRAVCMDQRPLGLTHALTVQDGLLTLVTLGIYAPTTIKVWCGN